MRERTEGEDISVRAIAGTHVVLLGLDVKREEARQGLLGFTIYRRQQGRRGGEWCLGGGKQFPAARVTASGRRNADAGADRGSDADVESDRDVKSDQAPIQKFLWSDYTALPGQTYTYRVIAQYGSPGALKAGEEVAVTITTENADDGTHGVYFNRGVAGSQAYSQRFGGHLRWYLSERQGKIQPQPFIKPEDVPDREAYKWLSRGLEEAMLAFIRQADGPKYALRAAVYEFTYEPAIQAFVDALESGADVKIVHHAKREQVWRQKTRSDPKDGSEDWGVVTTIAWESGTPAEKVLKNKYFEREAVKDDVCRAAEAAVSRIGLRNPDNVPALAEMLIERTDTTISHNKFIVLLEDGEPVQVWTGSTNYTAGGIFGQSNVGHIVRDPKVARKYLDYWKQLATDPAAKDLREWNLRNTPDVKTSPKRNSITPIFSPRPKAKKTASSRGTILDWYAGLIHSARQSVCFTAAFSVDTRFMEQFTRQPAGDPCQRYILLESRSAGMWDKYQSMHAVPANRIAWGEVLSPREAGDEADPHRQAIETLTGLNDHVNFLHTKYMLVDPLTDDPIVITGSANFSENSTSSNDENMLVIRGDTRVADIFLGEFMRLFNHYESRNERNRLSKKQFESRAFLSQDDTWTRPYFTADTPEQRERMLFR